MLATFKALYHKSGRAVVSDVSEEVGFELMNCVEAGTAAFMGITGSSHPNQPHERHEVVV